MREGSARLRLRASCATGAALLLTGTGAGTLGHSVLTDYELGIRRMIPMRVHLINETRDKRAGRAAAGSSAA